MALAFSLAFLLLNLVWVLLRKIALWWIRRLGKFIRTNKNASLRVMGLPLLNRKPKAGMGVGDRNF